MFSKITLRALIIISLGTFLFSCTCSNTSSSTQLSDPLQKKFPLGLMTPSYGVLAEEDLLYYSRIGSPAPFDSAGGNFSVWVCAETHRFKFVCRDFGKSDLPGDTEHNGEFSFNVELDNMTYRFYPRRAYEIDFCKEILNDWKKLAKNEPYLCAAGGPIDSGVSEDGKKFRGVVYEKIKSKHRCISWFPNECNNPEKDIE